MNATQIRTDAYQFSHGREPRADGWGLWMFVRVATGELVEVPTCTYRDAVASLPIGTYTVCP
jgi:hypothetical protein